MTIPADIAAVLDGEAEGCIIQGDCLEVMADMPDGCVDAVVTDPPYGIDYRPAGGDGAFGPKRFDNSSRVIGDSEPFDPAPLLAIRAADSMGGQPLRSDIATRWPVAGMG